MKTLRTISDTLAKILTVLACAYLLYILFACSAQVFSRYILNASFSWTEETARYAFADMGMLGIPVALRKGMHVNVDLLEERLSPKAKLLQKTVIHFCIFLISAVLLVRGWTLFAGMKGIYSSAVRIPMQAVYYAVPLCGLASMWMAAAGAIESVHELRKGDEACQR